MLHGRRYYRYAAPDWDSSALRGSMMQLHIVPEDGRQVICLPPDSAAHPAYPQSGSKIPLPEAARSDK